MESKKVSAVVLAAGKSTRMKSSTPKVIMDLGGRALIFYLLETLLSLRRYIKEIIVVLGDKRELVKETISKEFKGIRFAYQKRPNGTAKAVEAALPLTTGENVLVLCADTPLIERQTINNFLNFYFREGGPCAFITSVIKEENDLGRVLRDSEGRVIRIIEKQDLTGYNIEEVNGGIYCFKRAPLKNGLRKIKINKKKREYFLTDIIEIFSKEKFKISAYQVKDSHQILGINDQKSMAQAYNLLNHKFLEKVMRQGVRIIDPSNTFLSYDTKIGRDCVIYPFTFIEKNVIIGNNCHIGPFAHLRENTRIGDNTYIGNFVEVCRSKIGKAVRAKHFTYLGDATIEDRVNIGAGVVTANYDGKRKNKTFIQKSAFIGSDTIIVAPCRVGKNAITGAGAVVTKDVDKNTMVVGVPAKPLKRINK
jgi:bifunctional UDP-N-acetylglucosamine pyrophosphorylase/glucosamine-1-phosphate N-acetyltransferase